jgi:diguanylate cyclase (GGDEF)-like protein
MAERKTRTTKGKIARLTRANAVMSAIHSAVVRIRDRHALFEEACNIAISRGAYRMAWIGLPDGADGALKAAAHAGFNGAARTGVLAPLAPDAERGIRRVLRQGRPFVAQDLAAEERGIPFRKAALARGCRSLASLPLRVDGRVAGALLLYAGERDAFDEEELALAAQLADNVAFALAYIEKEEQLHYLASYDVLTKSANRNLLHDRLAQAIALAGRQGRQVAVIFVDVDNFKYVNDSLGHRAGDLLLKTVTERLGSCVRDVDTIARHGGDEFVVVLPDQSSEEQASQIIQRILTAIAQPIVIDGEELSITCSLGASFYPQDGADGETLLKNADAAMYRAKELGRNTFQFYGKEINARVSERLGMESSLRRAIERNELILRYQPQINLTTGRIFGAEALIRWRHPKLGTVPPERFIPLAEETGLIDSIGEWVLRTACAQNKAWQDARLPKIVVSVNLSARQFRQKGFAESISRVLRETGLASRYLGLELTEGLVMHDTAAGVPILENLKKMGVNLSIDDFGTGYSSLSYLKRFPIDELKIDQSFVRDVMIDPNDATIAKAIIALALELNLKVTAEGVETEKHIAFLQQHRCDQAQGFYFSRPLPSHEFGALLEQSTLHATSDGREP